MSFVKNLAKGGMFGLSGLAATASDPKKPKPTLTSTPTAINTSGTFPSMINSSPSLY